MKRSAFLKTILTSAAGFSMMDLKTFGKEVTGNGSSEKMPALFIGHGSPMNALEKNNFTQALVNTGKSLPRPKAILVVSAHWQTRGSFVSVSDKPKTIYDFGGFPKALYEVKYPAPGAPEYARALKENVKVTDIFYDHDMGLDHGAWTILLHLFPGADIPVFQLSLDYTKGPDYHYRLAQELASLRNKGVLVIGSGNIVHNLGRLNWENKEDRYDWSIAFDNFVKQSLESGQHEHLIQYDKKGEAAKLAVPTNEHYLPMLYAAALQQNKEELKFIYENIEMGSISMRCFRIG